MYQYLTVHGEYAMVHYHVTSFPRVDFRDCLNQTST